MIEVSLQEVFLIPLALNVAFVLLLWCFYNTREQLPAGGRSARIYRCKACSRVYEDIREVPMVACPRCGTLNDAVRS